ncbi:MAG: valine--tRNA ligase [Candidatus Portnoybacteria bacterium CG10_big_fil_rev_8_21_14_0_10_44_7]|uniref:Valine--tRNA ligase n=1 Tax=Candidatus Portnoybacteria bacterium CG10_big_fil_rev_8_21_14_0_10_44_7 TaxID=1974816 RepID=A0A2M8KJB6_9BACT|nr:MAG: valine--tRNA ligase [Candidatus Portnoybacteria bacterium CG10_big_fil_rev_8_21_14_0_10_44_7]
MDKIYNHNQLEEKIYQLWEKGGYFQPQERGAPFCIIMPPPNANEALHLGHGVGSTIQDILTRYHRMNGFSTLWIPGFDHAGFETQTVFEKKLEKKGQSRFQFDRDTLYKMIWDYVAENKDLAKNQLKRLGASCDWSRQKFTLDPEIIEVVYDTFKKLHRDGLVYRGQRIVNWCPRHQTSLSELETKNKEEAGKLWYIKYKLKAKSLKLKAIVVATTRPETMLGDMAVAVNPDDKRYQNLIGQKVILPIVNREIPIVADKEIDMEFGTGAVKITPAHDQLDFEIAQRKKLKIFEIIGEDGKMTDVVPEKYQKLNTSQARELILEDLRKQNLLEKEEDYKHTVKTCYKCGRTIEPRVMDQWFVKVGPLAKKAIKAVKENEVKFVSKKYEKVFMHWMKNIRDWNISRQIVWGIRIPVWYCLSGEAEQSEAKTDNVCYVISDKKPKRCPKCGTTEFIPETDTFDTWFSSGQWPFATLQTGEKNDFKTFYPTAVMETGWDILFFWVARMIMLGLYRTDQVPFRTVYLHGLVRDKDKQKMSKSKGNVINPLAVVDQHGADALRMALVFGSTSDSDIVLGEDKIVAQRKFVTKIWNASRFVLTQLGDNFNPSKINAPHSKEDNWVLKELDKTTKKVSQNIEQYKFHEAAQAIYRFFWHAFCDRCIENTKVRIKRPKNPDDQTAAQLTLYNVLLGSLKLLHPFMPFITEAIYQKLPHKPKKALVAESWPT